MHVYSIYHSVYTLYYIYTHSAKNFIIIIIIIQTTLMKNKEMQLLNMERESLRAELREMNKIVQMLCVENENASRNTVDYLSQKLINQQKLINSLNEEYSGYLLLLQGKYPTQLQEEIDRSKAQKNKLKKHITHLTKMISLDNDDCEIDEELLRTQLKLKTQIEEFKKKNRAKELQLEKLEEKLKNYKFRVTELNIKETVLISHVHSENDDNVSRVEQGFLKSVHLKERIKKLKQEIERKENLRNNEYNRKLMKLEQLQKMGIEFQETESMMEERIEELKIMIDRLSKQRSSLKKNKEVVYRGLKTEESLPLTRIKNLPEFSKINSVLEYEYPRQYRNLFLQINNSSQPKSRSRNIYTLVHQNPKYSYKSLKKALKKRKQKQSFV